MEFTNNCFSSQFISRAVHFTPGPSVVLVWMNLPLNNCFMAICTPSRSNRAIWLVNKKLACFQKKQKQMTQSISVFKISLFFFICSLWSSVSLCTCWLSCRSTLVSPKVLEGTVVWKCPAVLWCLVAALYRQVKFTNPVWLQTPRWSVANNKHSQQYNMQGSSEPVSQGYCS